MRRRSRAALAALFLLAAVGPASWAGEANVAALKLPEIGGDLFAAVDSVELVVSMVDGDAKPVTRVHAEMAKWRKGYGWLDARGKAATQLLFPIAGIPTPLDPKLRYKLDYRFNHEKGKDERKTDYAPLREGDSFAVTAPIPVDVVVVDTGTLRFTMDKSGLVAVTWVISRGKADPPVNGLAKAATAAGMHVLVDKNEAPSAKVEFVCLQRGVKKLPWEGNGKSLRETGLRLVLRNPTDCGE